MRQNRSHFFRIAGLYCVASLLLLSGCEQEKEAAAPMTPPSVVLSTATQKDVQQFKTFSGRTVACQTVDIISRTKGYLEEISYVPGEIVEPGTVLFSMQDFDYRIAQDKAYAELKTAVTQRDQAKIHYETAVKTNELTPNTVTADDMVDKKAAYENAMVKVYAAQAEYQYQTQQLYYTKVKSPIRGKVMKNQLHVGDYIQGTGEVLTTVVNMDPIYVEFDVPEAFFSDVYRSLVKDIEIPTHGPDASENSASSQGLKAPEIPEAVENKALTAANATSEETQIEKPLETEATNAEAKAAAATAKETTEAAAPTTSPAIPKPKSDFDTKTPDVSGIGLAGELVAKSENETKPEEDEIPFEITFPGDTKSPTYKGFINYSDNKVDRQTGTIMLRGEISNPKFEIYPGRICNVKISGMVQKGLMVIEERALCTDLNAKYVWVLDSKGLVEKRYVKVGDLLPGGKERILEAYTEESVTNIDGTAGIVKTGLKPGEQYIVEGIQKVRAGMPVSPKSVKSDAAQGAKPAAPATPAAK